MDKALLQVGVFYFINVLGKLMPPMRYNGIVSDRGKDWHSFGPSNLVMLTEEEIGTHCYAGKCVPCAIK